MAFLQADKDYFASIFEFLPFKYLFVLFSMATSLLLLPLFYGIVWYNCDSRRLIVNRLTSSICWCSITWIVFAQIPDLSRYLFGPFPQLICFWHFTLKNMIYVQIALLYDCIIICRFIFIFGLRNPATFYDELWSFFLNIWIFILCLVTQFVFLFLPGHQPVIYHMCLGTGPSHEMKYSRKFNFVLIGVQTASIVLHIALKLYIFVFNRKETNTTGGLIKIRLKMHLKNFSMFSFVRNFLHLIIFAFFALVGGKVNNMYSVQANIYPNNLFVHSFFLICPNVVFGMGSVMYYWKSKKIRNAVWRKITDFTKA
jgi:hypothetical protein